jgi:hypothetical protein
MVELEERWKQVEWDLNGDLHCLDAQVCRAVNSV